MLHDCIYQFLRLFYHSRFKPPQLEMTLSQFATPVIDLVLVLPLIFRLLKDFSRFSDATKMMIKSKPGISGYVVSGWICIGVYIVIWWSLAKVSDFFAIFYHINELSYQVRWQNPTSYSLWSKDLSEKYQSRNESQGPKDQWF